MKEVIDRVPTRPNRIKLTSESDGSINYYAWERADEPTVDGTPINKELFDSISTDLNAIRESHITKEVTLGTTWVQDSANGYYTQTVNVSWINAEDCPDIYVKKSGTYSNMKTQIKEFAKIVDAETSNGKIKFIASSATTSSLTLLVKVG